ncbi:type II toxin-antitoxin system RelB family antitoxin [Delftia acidovorans]
MASALSPIVSEFETAEQEASYERWFRAQVAHSLADEQPSVPHDQVMAELDEMLEQMGASRMLS